MRRNSPALNLLCGLLLTALLPGCFEPEEGCLDVYALNYQVNADEQCPDCCRYPQIKLDILHKIVLPDTSVNLQYDTEYRDGAGNPFRISRIQFYLTDVQLVRPTGDSVGVIDTLLLPLAADGSTELVEIEDNFALIDPGVFGQINMGGIRTEGDFQSIHFTLGLRGVADAIPPAAYPEDHPLSVESLYVLEEEARLMSRIQVYRIEPPGDTIRSDIRIGGDYARALQLPLPPPPVYLDPGFSPRTRLQVDYLHWFDGVDLVGDPTEQIAAKIVNNMTDAFSVINVTVENQ